MPDVSWGFTEQIPQAVFILNLKYEALRIDEKKYFGIVKIKIEDEDVCISDKERTLVDFVYNPMGSFANLGTVLKDSMTEIDLDKFIRYLIRFPNCFGA